MAVDLDAFTNFLGDIFNSEDNREAFQANPEGFLNQNGFGNATAFDVEQAAQRVFAPNQAAVTSQAGAGGPASLAYPLPDHDALAATPDAGGLSAAVEAVDYYQNVYNTTYDNDQAFDTSTNNNITAFGDVDLDQDVDNNLATGDGAVAGVEDAQVQTGDGIQAGGDIEDSNLVQGDVSDAVLADDISDSAVVAGSDVDGSVVSGDVSDSILGNDNQAIIDSEVGAASFGDGNATNVAADNAVLGEGTVVDGNIDGSANFGAGTQTVVEDSTLSESAVGGSAVESNDIAVEADDGSAVAFGGGDASGSNTDVAIDDSYVTGNVQAAGTDSTQAVDQSVDASTDIDDSFNPQNTDNSVNTAIEDSLNQDNSVNESFNPVDDADTTTTDTTAGDDIIDT